MRMVLMLSVGTIFTVYLGCSYKWECWSVRVRMGGDG